MESKRIRDDFICPRNSYYGDFTPENLAFNANLQEFATRVSFIAGLHTGGKMSTPDAYHQVKTLWHELKRSKKHLQLN
jgi:TRAP-type uncharacterized transport system substrate-binding protein